MFVENELEHVVEFVLTMKKRGRTLFYRVQARGGLADFCLAEVRKGMQIYIIGQPQMSVWRDRHGRSHSEIGLIALALAII
jgi:single-stranded DNA-binding protein